MHVTELPAPISLKGHTCNFRLAHPHETDKLKLYGYYQSRDGEAEIIVEGGLSSARRAEVVLHEVLHFIYHAYSISPKWGEERTVMMFGIGLIDLYRQNPKFLLWLTSIVTSASQSEKIHTAPGETHNTNGIQEGNARQTGRASQPRSRGASRADPRRGVRSNFKR